MLIQAGLSIDDSKAVTVILHSDSIDLSIIHSKAQPPAIEFTENDWRLKSFCRERCVI